MMDIMPARTAHVAPSPRLSAKAVSEFTKRPAAHPAPIEPEQKPEPPRPAPAKPDADQKQSKKPAEKFTKRKDSRSKISLIEVALCAALVPVGFIAVGWGLSALPFTPSPILRGIGTLWSSLMWLGFLAAMFGFAILVLQGERFFRTKKHDLRRAILAGVAVVGYAILFFYGTATVPFVPTTNETQIYGGSSQSTVSGVSSYESASSQLGTCNVLTIKYERISNMVPWSEQNAYMVLTLERLVPIMSQDGKQIGTATVMKISASDRDRVLRAIEQMRPSCEAKSAVIESDPFK
jgi:hypothetical protein